VESKMRKLKLVLFISLVAIIAAACGFLPGNSAKPTLDVNLIVQATFQALTAQAVKKPTITPVTPKSTDSSPASNSLSTTPTLPPAAQTTNEGGISGNLMYPASGMPSLRIVAIRVGGSDYYYVDTALGQSSYELDHVPPGVYHVVAYVLPGGLPGGYSKMVPCGLAYGCNDHSLIDVVVTAGNVTTGVDPNDYYADADTFPPNPVP
jgi:hypothetical protein